MRKILFICALLIPMVFLTTPARSEAADPEVVSVDFYPSGARFIFQLELNREGDFEFTLPGAFLPASVRTLDRGAASMRAEMIQVRPAPFLELEPLEMAAAEKRREVRLLEGRINATNHALRMIHETITADVSGRELIAHIERVVDRAYEKRLQYELALVDLELSKENVQREYREAYEELRIRRAELERTMPDRSRVVRVRGTANSTEPVLFEARTNAAQWAARYDINLDSETGQVSAVMFAVVAQRTGLNVEGAFSFHSRAPTLSVAAPTLWPLTVGIGRETIMRRRAADTFESEVLFAPAPLAEAEMDTSAVVMNQMREITSTIASVSLTGRGRIEGDGIAANVEFGNFEFPSTPRLIVIPEQNREAWIVADLDVIPDAFLPGEASLYVDGVASGVTYIADFGLQGTLPFGMAPRVTAEKRRSVGITGTTWLGRTGTLQDGFTIDVTNNMGTEQEIEVRGRLPLPIDDRVTMDGVTIDPVPELHDDENRLTWRITLGPGETGRITVEYTLRYPSDETLIYR